MSQLAFASEAAAELQIQGNLNSGGGTATRASIVATKV